MLALRLAVRELRGSVGGFVVLLVGIAFGTAAIAAIGLLSAAVLDGMRDGARASKARSFKRLHAEKYHSGRSDGQLFAVWLLEIGATEKCPFRGE